MCIPLLGSGFGGRCGQGPNSFLTFSMETPKITNPLFREQPKLSSVPKFLIIKKNEGNFSKDSPFLINKIIINAIGEPKDIQKLPSGELLVEAAKEIQATQLLKLELLGNFSVKVTPHLTRNLSKGVISHSELLNCPEEEILEHLSDQNIIAVKRITIKRDGQNLPTKHLIVTFNQPDLPKYVKVAYFRCSVRPYIPNPLRCFQCQRFGHSQRSCRGTLTCARCAEKGHTSEECKKTECCINCKGNHPAYSRTCKKWKFEKEVQTVKINQQISFPEARKIVASRMPESGKSYADCLKKTCVTQATQTENLFVSNNASTCSTPRHTVSNQKQRLSKPKLLRQTFSSSSQLRKKLEESRKVCRGTPKNKSPKLLVQIPIAPLGAQGDLISKPHSFTQVSEVTPMEEKTSDSPSDCDEVWTLNSKPGSPEPSGSTSSLS